MNFVAIDFETATMDRTSACSVGLAIVQNDKIVKHYSSLIRPPSLKFSSRNIALHGITPSDVKDKPTFKELWPKITQWIGNNLLVAHNAIFDISVLQACLQMASVQWEGYKYACTLEMARQLLPGLPNHKLNTLAELFGIRLKHHKAVDDASVCAQLAVLMRRLAGSENFDSFAHDFIGLTRYTKLSRRNPEVSVSFSMKDFRVVIGGEEENLKKIKVRSSAKPDNRFAGLRFVFTGELSTMSREDAESLVQSQGGQTSNSVSQKTDYVVVGDAVLTAYKRSGYTTGKLAKAVALQNNGEKVKIIGDSEFLTMIH